ncbi:MAG: dephospho-CoA kinase [Acidimicrobiia bacterium]|nr:dephospho-CoA kinase [Acidimicrobiia bacterium]
MQGPSTTDPLRLVVVGGIGAGKSTVLARLEALGALIVETDRIGHDVLEPWGSAFNAVAERWPDVVVDAQIDRAALAAIVFQDADALAELESISHPAIAREIARRSDEAGDQPVAVELPVEADLVGPGWTRVAVVAPLDTRLDRAVARGMDRNDAVSRSEQQLDDTAWIESADEVIVNDGTLEQLIAKVDEVWERLGG